MYKWAYKNKYRTERILASPGVEGLCPVCGEELVSKCGRVNIWHWSHKTDTLCDRWWENKTPWHRRWQALWPDACQEVVFDRHIADVCVEDTIIEFQHSHINEDVFLERTEFYLSQGKSLRWVFDTSAFTCELVKSGYQDTADMFCNNTTFSFLYNYRGIDPDYKWRRVIILFDFGQDLLVACDVYKEKRHWPAAFSRYKEKWHGFLGDHASFLRCHEAI